MPPGRPRRTSAGGLGPCSWPGPPSSPGSSCLALKGIAYAAGGSSSWPACWSWGGLLKTRALNALFADGAPRLPSPWSPPRLPAPARLQPACRGGRSAMASRTMPWWWPPPTSWAGPRAPERGPSRTTASSFPVLVGRVRAALRSPDPRRRGPPAAGLASPLPSPWRPGSSARRARGPAFVLALFAFVNRRPVVPTFDHKGLRFPNQTPWRTIGMAARPRHPRRPRRTARGAGPRSSSGSRAAERSS